MCWRPTASPRASSPAAGRRPTAPSSGETLWVTDAGVLAASTEPSYAGKLWRLIVPGGGAPTHKGSIGKKT